MHLSSPKAVESNGFGWTGVVSQSCSQTSSLVWEKHVEPFQLLGAVSVRRLLVPGTAVGSKMSKSVSWFLFGKRLSVASITFWTKLFHSSIDSWCTCASATSSVFCHVYTWAPLCPLTHAVALETRAVTIRLVAPDPVGHRQEKECPEHFVFFVCFEGVGPDLNPFLRLEHLGDRGGYVF